MEHAKFGGMIYQSVAGLAGVEPGSITEETNLEGLGLDSSDAVVLAMEIEELTGVEIEVGVFLRCATVAEAATESSRSRGAPAKEQLPANERPAEILDRHDLQGPPASSCPFPSGDARPAAGRGGGGRLCLPGSHRGTCRRQFSRRAGRAGAGSRRLQCERRAQSRARRDRREPGLRRCGCRAGGWFHRLGRRGARSERIREVRRRRDAARQFGTGHLRHPPPALRPGRRL